MILVWCSLAALRVFVFSAAFPFYSNVDEHAHLDLVVKYAHGHVPHGFEPLGAETSRYMLAYGSPEFRQAPRAAFENGYPPPLWIADAKTNQVPSSSTFQEPAVDPEGLRVTENIKNYESGQQPLYYVLASTWWRLGQWLGMAGLRLIYWVRFLNVLFAVVMVWLAHIAARLVFPEQLFPRAVATAVVAVAPIHAFYLVGNDVLSPLSFGIAFICLVRLWQAGTPGIGLGMGTGLALAAVYLQKLSNAPLLAVSGGFLALKIFALFRENKLRAAIPVFTALCICAGLPAAAWLIWTRHAFGDFAGTAAKLQFLTWTPKPFLEWLHHPMFTWGGLWTFVSALLVTFWQGEMWWHGEPVNPPAVDAIYVIGSILLILFGLISLVPKLRAATSLQRAALWFGFSAWISAGVFLGWLSISYDFGLGGSPSREYPFFTAGRLMLGGFIPMTLLCASGLNFVLCNLKLSWVRPAVLAGIIAIMLIAEVISDWTVFPSRYNWYHL